MGSPQRLNWSELYHKKSAFVAVWRTDSMLLGRGSKWKLRDHLEMDCCSSVSDEGNEGVGYDGGKK